MAGKAFLVAGAVNGALAVIAGAFVAHGAGLAPGSAGFHAAETAVRYHMWHALALVLVALLCRNAQAPGAPSATKLASRTSPCGPDRASRGRARPGRSRPYSGGRAIGFRAADDAVPDRGHGA